MIQNLVLLSGFISLSVPLMFLFVLFKDHLRINAIPLPNDLDEVTVIILAQSVYSVYRDF